MNDEQRELAVKMLKEDIDNLKKYNKNYEVEITAMEERIAPLKNQIAQNLKMIEMIEAVVEDISK